MEFCAELSAFQGLIISADNVHSFCRIPSRGGNEEKIKYIVESITNFLKDRRYLTNDEINHGSLAKVRKFAFYLILNSDLAVLSEMTDMQEIELFIWTIPTITKCLMCEMFWRLSFDRFVYEIMAYCDPELGLEISTAFIENMKYHTPSESLSKIKTISSALYKLMCRIFFFNFNRNTLVDKLTMIFSNFQKAINFFTEPPKPERLDGLSRDEKYKYVGRSLSTMLHLVYECLVEFMTSQELERISDTMYTLTYIGGVVKNVSYRPCECNVPEIVECLNKCHLALLDKCQELIMGVSVDIFCAWSEFEDNGKSTQQRIGELCHKVQMKLLSISSVAEHPIINMINQISRKPADLSDVIQNSTVETIVENINSSDDKVPWLKALVAKTDQLYQNVTLINCVANNLKFLNDEECYDIYKSVKTYADIHPENRYYLDSFIVKLFQCCNLSAKHDILDELFSGNRFVDMPESEEFLNLMTETFNKLIVSPNADFTDILCLFLQNPRKVYTKIFDLAAQNAQQTNLMLKAMKLIQKFSCHYYNSDTEPCVIRVTQEGFESLDSEAKKYNFIKFLCSLKNSGSITDSKLLLLIIMPRIHQALNVKSIDGLHIQCKLLSEAYKVEELLPYRAPLLAMLAQVLEVVRWKMDTYVPNAPLALQLSLDIQQSLFSTYDSGIPDTEGNWLRNKIRYLRSMNMYYYRKLWNPPGINFIEVISGMTLDESKDTEELVPWLSTVLSSCTQLEWCYVWDSFTIFGQVKTLEIFHKTVALVTYAENETHSDSTWPAVLNCYRNFVYVVRYKFFKEPLTNSQVSAVAEKVAFITRLVPEPALISINTILLPLFSYLAEKKSQYNFDITSYLRSHVKNDMCLDVYTRVFMNGNA